LYVTKHLSASHRTVLASLRPGLVWAFSLAVGWQGVSWLQVVGFVIQCCGTAVYYEVGAPAVGDTAVGNMATG